ncbi:MAG: phosphotransferase [Trueperella sp.]|nr:phosphotransferase [Trueperella sp.]
MDTAEQLAIVEPTWPVISDDDAARVCAQIPDLPAEFAEVTWFSGRPMAAACRAELTDGTALFIKRYSPALMVAPDLAAKHQFVNTLHAQHFPAVPFLSFATGQTWLQDHWFYEVSPWAPGTDPYRQLTSWQAPSNTRHWREIGRTAAQLRKAAADIPAPQVFPTVYQTRTRLVLGNPLDAWEQWVKDFPELAQYLADRDFPADLTLTEPFAAQLAELATEPMRWTHGDLHASNLLWSGDQVCSVIDFGMAHPNPPLLDLAIAIERHAIDWLGITAGNLHGARPQVAAEIIAGYQEVLPLTANERRYLPALIALCQVEAGLVTVEYSRRAPVPAANADWAYDVYFKEHLQWFHTTPGQEFLAQISSMTGEK